MTIAIDDLAAAVRRNCDVADARHAQDMSLCQYLLAMREHFRWETGLPPGQAPDRTAVGAWIAAREARWEELAPRPFEPLAFDGRTFDAFNERAVNAALAPAGWVYGAARGPLGRPHFFLGRLAAAYERHGLRVVEVGEEIARDLLAAPAAFRDGAVVLRRDAFARWLWTSAEGWDGARGEGAMRATLAAYGWRDDRARAIARMAEEQRETLLLHELGEHRAGLDLGESWDSWFGTLEDARAERLARAVRDLLADCLVTLPALLDRRDEASLHFWFATFAGLRRALFPRLVDAYDRRDASGWDGLARACAAGAGHWRESARRLVTEPALAIAEGAADRLRLA